MRLVSYNILDGGVGRTDDLATVIARQRADIVCLAEAEEVGVVVDLAQRLKMDFIHGPGNTKASALLCRFPIRQSINHALLHRNLSKSFLEAMVVDSSGFEWIIAALHLHARATEEDEQKREGEIAEILKVLEKHRSAGRPHLLAGDFNANAPYQKIDPERCKPKTREAWQKNGGRIPRRVVQQLLDAGYLDSLRMFDPPAAETAGTFSTEFPGQRVDYIFTFGLDSAQIREAWIDSDSPARHASDHFPIGAQLVLKPPHPLG